MLSTRRFSADRCNHLLTADNKTAHGTEPPAFHDVGILDATAISSICGIKMK